MAQMSEFQRSVQFWSVTPAHDYIWIVAAKLSFREFFVFAGCQVTLLTCLAITTRVIFQKDSSTLLA